MTRRTLALLALISAAHPALAQDAGSEATELDAILVTDPEEEGDPRPAVSAVDLGEMPGSGAGTGLTGLLNGIAGVTTEQVAGDPSIAVNIRGLQGDGRVVVTIDGARQNFGRAGHGANGTFTADPEMLREIAVTRGPAGSDAAAGAIGGTLALRTVEPGDLIAAGETSGSELRLRYGTLTADPTVHLAWATQFAGGGEALLAFTRADAADYRAGDGTLVHAANENLSILAKAGYVLDNGQELGLSYSQIASDFITGQGDYQIPRDNDQLVTNLVFDWGFGFGAWSGEATLYRSTTEVRQRLVDEDLAPFGPTRSYRTDTNGLRAEAGAYLGFAGLDHDLALVADLFRDGVKTHDPEAAGGSLTPSGQREISSFLIEDALSFATGTGATLGLRYDDYGLQSDDGSAGGSKVSPSLTLSQELGAVTLFATLAEGYRPPTLSEALVNGQHPEPADFYIRPNPDLQPESSLTREIGASVATGGLFLADDSLTGQVTVYRNDVADYIGLVWHGGLFNGYYQYDNIDRVRLDGLELELAYDAGFAFAAITGQLTDGTNLKTGDAISGVAPSRGIVTLGLRSTDRMTEFGGRLTSVAGREDGQLTAKAWRTVDLFLTREIAGWGEATLSLNNIRDETYTQYLNTQPSPGFNALASLILRF